MTSEVPMQGGAGYIGTFGGDAGARERGAGLVLADELGEPLGRATLLGITVGLSLVP
jgi:hypothetical protein